MIEQGGKGASGPEELVFRRLCRNPRDPGITLSYTFSLSGALDVERLERALRNTVVDHFPDLLCVFDQRARRVVKRQSFPPVSFLQVLCDTPDWLQSEVCSSVQLQADTMFRFVLVRVSADFHYLRLSFSHLVFDGTCYALFVAQLEQSYARLPADALSSNDPSVRSMHETKAAPIDADFWKSALQGRKLGQSLGFLGGSDPTYHRFVSVRRTVRGDDYRALCDFVAAEQSSLFRLMVAALAVSVFRYDRDQHIDGLAIAHTVDTRTVPAATGNFANVIPLFVPDRCEWSPRDYLAFVRSERHRTRPHQRLPSSQLIALADERCNRNTPVLNLVVNESQGLLPGFAPSLPGIRAVLLRTPATGGPFDLGVTFAHDEDGLRLSVDVPEELAPRPMVSEFTDNLITALSHFVSHPDAPVSSLVFSSKASPVAQGPLLAFDGDDLFARIQAQAQATPEKLAVCFGAAQLNYTELLAESKTLARTIGGVTTPDALRAGVGLAFSRSERLPVAMLAALSLGIPFVPLEQSLPPERLQQMLETTGLRVVLCDEEGYEALVPHRPDLIFVPIERGTSSEPEPFTSTRPESGTDVAYVLFTSGSTGIPKGVAITRRNLLNFLLSIAVDPGFDAGDRFLALTPTSFDISILELLLPLFLGACLHVVDDATRRSAVDLAREIEASGVNVVQATPATWRMLKAVGWSSSRPLTLLCGGEALTPDIADYLLDQGHGLYNMYGPTEATIWASCAHVRKGQPIHLGVPVLNTCFHIVDEHLMAVADGQIGELLIEGECVGAGYLGQRGGAFLSLGEGRRAYRTGDLVRSLGEARIAYVGRRDNQRKINGHRIELDEISLRLRGLIGDTDVFTVVRERPTSHLCAFYRGNGDLHVDADRVLDAAKRLLPAYMVPAMLVRLQELPLTPNGKVDQRFLSTCELPAQVESVREASLPRSNGTTVDALRALILRALDIQIDDADASLGWLGFNSISYNHLSHAIETEFDANIPPHRFYAINTLNALAGEINTQKGRSAPQATAISAATTVAAAAHASPSEKNRTRSIAIVGYSATMPGGMEGDTFWDALMRRENFVAERVRPGFRAPIHAAFLDQIEGFDARFFSISPLEAKHMDPRQRLLLQSAWRAVEDSGHAASALSGRRIGCYVAATACDYATLQARAGNTFTPYSLSGSSLSILANRISSFFNWTGPSCTIDTACSGSLGAIVRACNDLAAGVCETALVGAINVIADDQISYGLEAGNFMSPHYRCASFDEQADGYVRGEGFGCFLLKPLATAVADGDAIHGVIESFVENHGGRSTSLTAPNPQSQTQLILSAYTPELAKEVGYIETHGTGTRLGDPIEIDALKQAWNRLGRREDGDPIWLGAVKSNIGHLEPAAGVASLTKVLLAMRHGVLPPNLHFSRLNPLIELAGTPFAVLNEPQPWPQRQGRRVAGISSFGFGGSNAHIVVAAPPPSKMRPLPAWPALITLSAKSETALVAIAQTLRSNLLARMARSEQIDLQSLAYTLNIGRTHFEVRAAWVVESVRELVDVLACDPSPTRIAAYTQRTSDSAPRDKPETLQQRLDRVLIAYLQGSEINWNELHPEPAGRMHLPTYRFDSQYYWFDRGHPGHAQVNDAKAAEGALS